MKKLVALFLTILLLPLSLAALDFGLLLHQNAGVKGVFGEDSSFEYQANLIPRLSGLLGDFGDFIVTAGVTAGIDDKFYFIPELLRTELSWRFGNAKITGGRMHYTDPLAYIADGLFDGLQFVYDSRTGTLSAGVWYTGLLYKKKANITMTAEDTLSLFIPVDYGNITGTYFASQRVMLAADWEHPAFMEMFRINAAFITQFDLNGRDNYLHSQYITAKIGMPVNQFMFELGVIFELTEIAGGINIALAGELSAFWTLPTAFLSRLSFTGYFSSGRAISGSFAAFTPITAKSCGDILNAEPSGISTLSLDYTVRLHKNFSAGLTSTYFIRNDLGTYAGYPIDVENNDKFLLGNEFFARLVWSPFSDLQVNFGAGIFLPFLGNAAPNRKSQWRIKLAAIMAIY